MRVRTTVTIAAVLVLLGAGPSLSPPAGAAPEPEVALGGIVRVDTGEEHSCGVTSGRQLRCWGDGSNGKLGINDLSGTAHNTAVTVLNGLGTGPLTGVVAVSVSNSSSCSLMTSRQVRCWGSDFLGQLGNGTATGNRYLPVPVTNTLATANLTGVTQLSVGYHHACAVLTNRQVRCWGDNDNGELGRGDIGGTSDRPVVVRAVTGAGPLTGVTHVSAGDDHSCARLTTGQLRCWGWGPGTGYGGVTNRGRPVVVRGVAGAGPLTGVTQVSAGSFLTCARLASGQARCWGDNTKGELGIGVQGGSRLRPAVVESANGAGALTGVTQVVAGEEHACAILAGAGQVRCWGTREYGQLGDGSFTGVAVRPQVVRTVAGPGALTGVTQLGFDFVTTCARLSNGQARCWGYNAYGGLGNGNFDSKARPQIVQA
jgi:alpha-tubulin suppressor-like RCC1 family protein